MRIAFIIPSITNFHTFLSELSEQLIDQGHDVFVLAGEKPIVTGISPYSEKISPEWIRVDFPRNFQARRHFVVAKQINKIILSLDLDLIHVHFSAAMFTVSLAKNKDWPPVIATIHGLAWPTRKGNAKFLLKRAELNAARKMEKVIVLNQEDEGLLKENGVKNCEIIYPYGIGCIIEQFEENRVSDEISDKIRKDLGIKRDDIVFIFIGRQTAFKGYGKVIRAFMKNYHSNSNSHLLLLGEKDHIHLSGLNEVEESLIHEIPNIHKLGWKLNIQDYLKIADINVFPSEREGFPVNIMESLSMGVPVITIDSRGCRDIIEDGVNGLIIDDYSCKKLALAMKHLEKNSVLRKELSVNALDKRADYDRNKFIKTQMEFYKQSMVKYFHA